MKVYIDMDGVLADFFSEALKKAHIPKACWSNVDFHEAEKIMEEIGAEEGFFRNLAKYPTTNTLIQSVVNIAGEYTILSSPLRANPERSKEEKLEWIAKNLMIDPKEVIITSDKAQYAEGNILIDDYGHNIRAWEAAGGYGIKYQADENNISDALIPLMALHKQQP